MDFPPSKAVAFYRFFYLGLLKKVRVLAYWLFWIFLGIFLYGFLGNRYEETLLTKLSGFTVLSLSLFGAILVLELFQEKLKSAKGQDLSFELALALNLSKGSASRLLVLLLKQDKLFENLLNRALLDTATLLKLLQNSKEPLGIDEVIKKGIVNTGDALVALAEHHPVFQKTLVQANLFTKDIRNLADWAESLETQRKERKKFWGMKNLRRRGTLARNWTAGYTPTLDAFSSDLSEIARKQGVPLTIGHEDERSSLERILSQQQTNNALLVGEPGSGRRNLVLNLAYEAALGETLNEINYKRFVELDIQALVARITQPEELEKTLDKIFREVAGAGNVVLIIDELHNFVGGSGRSGADRPGAIDITGVLAPYLRVTNFPFIGITTFQGLHKYLEQNASLMALLAPVELGEITDEQTLPVLEQFVGGLEQKHKRIISYPALRDAIALSSKYVQGVPQPRKSIELLEEAMAYLSSSSLKTHQSLNDQTKEKVLLPRHIAYVLSEKTQIPIGEIETKEREVLLSLEDLLHKRIINQEEAIGEVSSALRRARSEVSKRSGPMGSFLFLGPTGVGKTETAKALAAVYFGSENRMIRLDMSEFQNPKDVERLLGSAEQQGLLTTQVRENPFSLVLLDELEKAHPNILNLFLQVLDEGHITDGLGRKVSFQHTIIIATSNAGYQLILEAIKENKDFNLLKREMIDYLFKQGIYRPEFLNRFDGVMLFKPLTKEHLLSIAELMLSKVKKGLAEKGIEFVITGQLKEKMVELGYDPIFGARPMKRVIQDKVEDALAVGLLKRELIRGTKVEVDPSDFSLKIS
ncbi:MAG: ATPase [Parcubacteria group bacterium Greene0714_21]|nr:MAG: ATPase [Parcubacteria group bacterium Greene0416_39]TSC98520.1 MAG: ATPase [Parcubacteria group bacterium Greene1014_47]TSD04281.1 MAG: ATPase [Parcubacteria group bacterium Greene0714_21]